MRDAYFEDTIVKDLHHIMALVAKDKQFWINLGYGDDKFTPEEAIGYMLKTLAERGSKIACTGKIEDMAPYEPEPSPLPRKEVISVQPGDVIVVINPVVSHPDVETYIRLELERAFPNNTSIVLSNGMTLEVYREQEKAIQRPEGFCDLYLKTCIGDLCSVGDSETCPHKEQNKE